MIVDFYPFAPFACLLQCFSLFAKSTVPPVISAKAQITQIIIAAIFPAFAFFAVMMCFFTFFFHLNTPCRIACCLI
ncbi:MAG: hypothetical protein L6V88_10755 [Anaerotruncus sp.]|nr:MAG: hypothetical protein L6V88_10755 [Anaerotruncus sp.]